MKDPVPLVALVVALVGAAIVFVLPGDHTAKLQLAIGYALLVLVFLYGAIVLIKMATGTIDLRLLLAEDGGGASMSRFQLLIFTLVIALSFFLLVAKGGKFPDVSPEVLALLGISATTYGVSKGIQAGAGLKGKEPTAKEADGGKNG